MSVGYPYQDKNDTLGWIIEWEWDGLIHLKTTLTWFQYFGLSLEPFSNENVSWTSKWGHTLSRSQFETTTMDTETETASWTWARGKWLFKNTWIQGIPYFHLK